MTHAHSPIRRISEDQFRNLLREEEKELLKILPELVEEAIRMNSPYVTRLFPPTYPFDDSAQAKVEKCRSDSLAKQHMEVLGGFTKSINQEILSVQDVATWVEALNDIRLLMGTALDVYEDMDLPSENDPKFGDFVIYNYLAWLQSSLLEFLAHEA